MQLMVVDLPAPLGPSRPKILPGRRVEADVFNGHQLPKLLAQSLNLDHARTPIAVLPCYDDATEPSNQIRGQTANSHNSGSDC